MDEARVGQKGRLTHVWYQPGFPRWIGSTAPKTAEKLAEPRIPPFTRRLHQDSAA